MKRFYLLCLLCGLLLAVVSCRPVVPLTAVPSTSAATETPLPATATPVPTPTPSCTATRGTTEQLVIPSPTLGEKLTFTLYLPPCYSDQRSRGYPVIYLFHGQNQDDTLWPSLGAVDMADLLIDQGSTPFLMVFPYEVHNWDPVSESKFGDAIIDDLIPYIESHYHVCTERACREIGGVSRGGGWAMHLALTYFEMFHAVGGHSMGWFAGDLYRVENLLTTYSPADFPLIYLDRGDQDYLRDSIDLYEQNLTSCAIQHEYIISPGQHSTTYWSSQIQKYMQWYADGFNDLK